MNVLRAVSGGRAGVRSVASCGIVTNLSASEAETFSDAFGSFGGGEFG